MNFKITSLLFLMFVFAFIMKAQDVNLEWVKSIGTGKFSQGVSYTIRSEVDAQGNVYSAGCFFDTLDFNPGPGINEQTGSIYILKLDAAGNFIWAKTIMASARINDLKSDSNGNIYITGIYSSTADFDPGPGVFNLTCVGAITDVVLLKLDPSGNFIWAKSFGGIETDKGYSLTTDPSGNLYCCGFFSDTADFDPGAGTFNLITINSSFFILKLDPSGNFIWAKSMGYGSIFSYEDYRINSDANGNIYTTGRFEGTADFDPGPGIYNLTAQGLSTDIFIQKLDASGNFIWAKSINGSRTEVCRSFTIDKTNNLILTGFYDGTVDFNPGAGIFNLSSLYAAVFIQKLDESGNFIWTKSIGIDSSSIFSTDIATDDEDNLFITGWFYNTFDFDPGPDVFNLSTYQNSTGMFILNLNTNGIFNWVKFMGGHDYFSISESITLDYENNIITSGSFSDVVDFDPESGIFNLSNTGNADLFIQKLSQCKMISVDLGNDTSLCEGNPMILNAAFKNVNYQWQDNSTDSVFTPTQTGLYSVLISRGNCKLKDSINIIFDKQLNIELGNDTTLCEGDILQLKATGSNATYQWQDNSSDSFYTVNSKGKYTVTVKNTCGLEYDEIYVEYENCGCIFIPSSFTPNADGKNDFYYTVHRCDFSEFNLTVFDRWGEIIFETNNADQHWDGSYREKSVPEGIYVYNIKYRILNSKDAIQKSGHITVIR